MATTSTVNSSTSTVNTNATGNAYIAGAFSGINSTAIIANAVYAKLAPKRQYDTQISANLTKITAFQALRSQADQFKTLSDALKSDLVGNVFAQKQLTYASSSSTPASSLITATATKDALAGTNTVIVNQIAKTFTAEGTNQSSATTALGYTGTFDLVQTGGGTVSTISITAADTLQTLRNKINAVSTTTGVSADIVQVSPGVYRLQIKGSQSALPVAVSNITGTDVLQSLGVLTSGGAFANVTQPAQQASITINNTTVTSNTNRFENVLTGLSIDVTNADPSTTITLTVGNNVDGVKTAIKDFVAGYNALKATIEENQKVNADGTVSENAYLYNEYLNSSLGTGLSRLITGLYGTGIYNGLRSLGISINSSNELVINENTFNDAVSNHYSDVRSVFETQGSNKGLADEVSTFVNGYSNFVSGSIQKQIGLLQTNNADLTKKSDDIQKSVDAYQTQLITKYAELEAKLKRADTIKKQIVAILDANNNN